MPTRSFGALHYPTESDSKESTPRPTDPLGQRLLLYGNLRTNPLAKFPGNAQNHALR